MAIRFNGSEHVQYTDPGFSIGAGVTYTVSFWVRPRSLAISQFMFNAATAAAGIGMRIDTSDFGNSGKIRCFNNRATSSLRFGCDTILRTSKWQNVIVTFPGGFTSSAGRIYVNGENRSLTETGDGSGAAVTGDGDYSIGAHVDGTSAFTGEIADVCVWDRVLNIAEQSLICYQGFSGLYIRKGLRFAVPFVGSSIIDYKGSAIAEFAGIPTNHPPIKYPFNRLENPAYNILSAPTGGSTLGIMTTRTGWWGDL